VSVTASLVSVLVCAVKFVNSFTRCQHHLKSQQTDWCWFGYSVISRSLVHVI